MSLHKSSDNGALLPKVGEPDFFHFGMISRLTGSAFNQMGMTGFIAGLLLSRFAISR